MTFLHELTKRRQARNCCQAVEGIIDSRWCERCKEEFQHLSAIGAAFKKIYNDSGSWGHWEEAKRRLQTITEIPMPKKEEFFAAARDLARRCACSETCGIEKASLARPFV